MSRNIMKHVVATGWIIAAGLISHNAVAAETGSVRPAVDCKPTFAAIPRQENIVSAEWSAASQQSQQRDANRRDRQRGQRQRAVKPCVYLASN